MDHQKPYGGESLWSQGLKSVQITQGTKELESKIPTGRMVFLRDVISWKLSNMEPPWKRARTNWNQCRESTRKQVSVSPGSTQHISSLLVRMYLPGVHSHSSMAHHWECPHPTRTHQGTHSHPTRIQQGTHSHPSRLIRDMFPSS